MIPMMRQSLLPTGKPVLTNVVDHCINYNIYSVSELRNVLPLSDYAKLYKGKINEVNGLVNAGINIAQTYMTNIQSENRFLWLLSHARHDYVQSAILDKIMEVNCQDKLIFARAVFDVLMEVDPKVNTLFLYGPPNTGKTLLMGLLADLFVSVRVTIQDCKGSFYFQQMLNKSIIYCDELFVTKDTCEQWKMIMAGHVIDINCKNSEYQRLKRTPVLISSNHSDLGRGYLPPIDEKALKVRCHKFHMSRNVEMLMTSNIDKEAFAYWLYDCIKDDVQ